MAEKKRKKIKVQDLKPKKDARGGVVANVHSNLNSRFATNQSHSTQSGGGRQTNLHI
jgi:hypothetical protein